MKKLSLLVSMLLALSVSNTVLAHPDHDDTPPPARVSLDLVSKKDGATIFVTKGGEKVATAGATGTLTLVNGKSKSEIALKAVGDNGMETVKSTKIPVGTRASATIKFPDQSSASDDFIVQ